MNPLKVALVHRGHWYRYERIDGQFAYPVPEFTWTHHEVDKAFRVNLDELDADVVWWDEAKHKDANCRFLPVKGRARQTPLVYYCLYPTLTMHHFRSRRERAKKFADVVCLEHDDLERWHGVHAGIYRLAYSVDENLYQPAPKTVDVGFYCFYGYSPERPAMAHWLADFCQRKGYSFLTNQGDSGRDYPQWLAKTKVVVHLNRTRRTRPPRIFDVAACGGALLSHRMPEVSGEKWEAGVHYVAFDNPPPPDEMQPTDDRGGKTFNDADCTEVAAGLEWLLDGGNWETVAAQARAYVLKHHTWAVRAQELQAILLRAFPSLKERVA